MTAAHDHWIGDLAPDAVVLIRAHLDELKAGLPCSRRHRAAVRAEVGAGLADDVQARIRSGQPVAAAARAAIHAFGSPRALASELAAELAVRTAHRIGGGLLVSGPFVGIVWLLALPSGFSRGLPGRVADLWSALPVVPFLLLLAVPCAVVATAAGGRLRWRVRAESLVVPASWAASGACVLVDVTLLAWLPTLIATDDHLGRLVALAVVASSVRLAVVAVALNRGRRLSLAA